MFILHWFNLFLFIYCYIVKIWSANKRWKATI